jgi:hypothetical protein
MPEIIFSYSSHQGTCLRAFALSSSWRLISFAAIVICVKVESERVLLSWIYILPAPSATTLRCACHGANSL